MTKRDWRVNMLKKSVKRFLAMLIAGIIIFTNMPAEVFATETLAVHFSNDYAQVGVSLKAIVEGGENASYEWYINGSKINNQTDSYTPTQNDLEKWIEVVVTDGEEKVSTKLYCSKLPVVYIDTENGAQIVSKEDYINATMRIQGNEEFNSEKTLYNGDIEIRGRGNSTWGMPKKPYKIKLDKKTDLFGMGKNKHWVLLANYSDESLMRNTLAYNFSGELGMEHMSTVWVDVILNGEYVGNYQLCEQIRVDETRVDIFDWEGFAEDSATIIAEAEGLDEDDLAEYMLEKDMGWITSGKVQYNGKTYNISKYPEIQIPSINGGYLLELDEYFDEVSKFKTDTNQPIMFKNPEFVNTNADMMKFVQTYVQAFEDAVQSSNYTALYEGQSTHYSELFDFDSLVDYWLINEIFFNEEFNKKSTYMYKEIDELMKMGPMWDMDYSSGGEGITGPTDRWATLYFNAKAQQNMWYKDLVKDPYFLMKVQERYWEIRNVQIKNMIDSIDVYYELLKESGNANSERWPRQTFESDVAGLRKWMNSHITWLDQQMATEDSLDRSFLGKDTKLSLSILNEDSSKLSADDSKQAPSDGVVIDGKNVTLKINGNGSIKGTAEIYLNGKSLETVQLGTEEVSYKISSEKLSAETGYKNVIEVKVRNTDNVVISSNYVTVKEEPCSHGKTEVQVVKAPTCVEKGTNKEVCLICGETIVSDIEVAELGHDYAEEFTVDKNATCTEEGLQSQHCTREGCNATANEKVISALGHKYGEWVVVKEATTSEEGLKESVCSVCGDTQSKQIDKLPVEPEDPKPEDPKPEHPKPEDPKPEQPQPEKPNQQSPVTGDSNMILGYIVILFAAIAVIVNKRKNISY